MLRAAASCVRRPRPWSPDFVRCVWVARSVLLSTSSPAPHRRVQQTRPYSPAQPRRVEDDVDVSARAAESGDGGGPALPSWGHGESGPHAHTSSPKNAVRGRPTEGISSPHRPSAGDSFVEGSGGRLHVRRKRRAPPVASDGPELLSSAEEWLWDPSGRDAWPLGGQPGAVAQSNATTPSVAVTRTGAGAAVSAASQSGEQAQMPFPFSPDAPLPSLMARLSASFSDEALRLVAEALSRVGRSRDGIHLFDVFRRRLESRSVLSYNAELLCLAVAGNVRRAFALYDEMRTVCAPNLATFHTLIMLCARRRKLHDAEGVFERMEESGLAPTLDTLNLMIAACASVGDIDRAQHYYDLACQLGFEPDERSFATVLHAYRRAGMTDRLGPIVERMRELGIATNGEGYNTVLVGLLAAGEWEKAVDLFTAQDAASGKDDGAARTRAHGANAHKGGDGKAAAAEDGGVIPPPTVSTFNTMIGACLRRGDVAAAFSLFEDMGRRGMRPTAYTFAKLARGCNDPDKALAVLSHMRSMGMPPSPHVYTSALYVLASAGRSEDAFSVLEEMRRDLRFEETCAYNALLDGFRFAGRVEDALAVADLLRLRMVKVNGRTVMALVSLHATLRRDAVSAFRVFSAASNAATMLESMVPSTYDVLVDALAHARMWKEIGDVARRMCGDHLVPHPSNQSRRSSRGGPAAAEEPGAVSVDRTWAQLSQRLGPLPSEKTLGTLVEGFVRTAHAERDLVVARRLARHIVLNTRRGMMRRTESNQYPRVGDEHRHQATSLPKAHSPLWELPSHAIDRGALSGMDWAHEAGTAAQRSRSSAIHAVFVEEGLVSRGNGAVLGFSDLVEVEDVRGGTAYDERGNDVLGASRVNTGSEDGRGGGGWDNGDRRPHDTSKRRRG